MSKFLALACVVYIADMVSVVEAEIIIPVLSGHALQSGA